MNDEYDEDWEKYLHASNEGFFGGNQRGFLEGYLKGFAAGYKICPEELTREDHARFKSENCWDKYENDSVCLNP